MPLLEREEYVEQAYFFRTMRERILDGVPTQELLARIGEEILSTTKLPLAIGYLNTELKMAGLMGPAMVRLAHYFTPFQTLVVDQAEQEVASRFPMDQALLILEREAAYRSAEPTAAGLFIYQFEAIARNRLGYDRGLEAVAADPFYDEPWHDYIINVRSKLGDVEFADLIYLRSAFLVAERRRRDPEHQPKTPALFGEKEGKIAKANRGRDPLYLFAALQRQLGYPEVPRPKRPDESATRLQVLEQRLAQMENRVKILEMDVGTQAPDLGQVLVRPEDTAGTPAGWGDAPTGKSPGWSIGVDDLDLDLDSLRKPEP